MNHPDEFSPIRTSIGPLSGD
uniref:Uncharacterized protein n=1 Tax=Anopheles minimus TaxID=112268 RepID=A0A182WPZ0_9DIPT